MIDTAEHSTTSISNEEEKHILLKKSSNNACRLVKKVKTPFYLFVLFMYDPVIFVQLLPSLHCCISVP